MPVPFPRVIFVVHSMPGRLRLRLPWLHDHRALADPLADQLAKLPGMGEVRIRPYSGSTLCRFDPRRLDDGSIVSAVREATGVDAVVRPGEAMSPAAEAALRLS